MAIAPPSGPAPTLNATAIKPLLTGSALARIARTIGTGITAAADLRRLNNMTEGQLAGSGLSRDGLPREIFQRHFAE